MVTKIAAALVFLICLSPVLSAEKSTGSLILIREVENKSPREENEYITGAVKKICMNEIKSSGLFDFLDEAEHDWTKKDLSRERLYQLCKKNGISYILDAYYFTHENRITCTLKLTSVAEERVIALEENSFDINEDLFFHVQSLCLKIIRTLQTKTDEKPIAKERKKEPGAKETEKFISRYEEEFFIYMNLSFTYTLLHSTNIHLNIFNQYNIDSPINKNIHTFSPHVTIELYKSRKQHYLGGGLSIMPPVPVTQPGFGSSNYMRFYAAFGYNKQYFFKWSFDYMSIYFKKYAKDLSEEAVDGELYYFGFGFDFAYAPLALPFLIKGGFSLFPPFVPLTENNTATRDGLPFSINLGNKITYNSFLIPLVGRFAAAFFFTDSIGLELGYQLSFLHMHYDVVFDNNNIEVFKYLGRELTHAHSISIGVTYKTVIK